MRQLGATKQSLPKDAAFSTTIRDLFTRTTPVRDASLAAIR